MAPEVADSDLRSYYEEEARRRLRKPLTGRRVSLRDAFVSQLNDEGCSSVIDFGSGPGGDGAGFEAAGHRYVGIDLAHGNAQLAAESGLCVVQGSIDAPPLRAQSFDAGWSMSTLMHVSESDVAETLRNMVVPLRSGAPLLVGLWGGDAGDVEGVQTLDGRHRLFRLRPFDTNGELLKTCGVIESQERWAAGPDIWEYQVFRMRIP